MQSKKYNREWAREYRKKHPERYSKQKENTKIKNQERRLVCLKHYSSEIPFCACCEEKEIKFLSIDHINGGGNKHRKEIIGENSKGGNIYVWLIKNNFPEGFQILCHNCNMAKGFYKICPHKEKR